MEKTFETTMGDVLIKNVMVNGDTMEEGIDIHINNKYSHTILGYYDIEKLTTEDVEIIINKNIMIPPSLLYGQYLHIAAAKFNLTLDECRNRYGQSTLS